MRGKKYDRGRFRLEIEMDVGEKRVIRGRKARDSRAKSGRNGRFWTTLPAHLVTIAMADRREPTVATGFTHPKKTLNRSLAAHIINYMSHTSEIERIFNALIFRDHAHNRVHFEL